MDIASSSYILPWKYDVLINFTGEDIHRKFVSHLNSAFSTVGLTTFLHHPNAVKSTHIQQPILSHCHVVIVVFTQTYSKSAWCLDQLQQIIKWHETYCRHVLPVYYEIQPSDVRLQKGDFGKALKATAQQTFSGEELEHGMSRWNHALTKAANFFGWDESNHRSDAELVDKIVKSVVNLPILSATKFPVRLQSYVEDLIRTIKSKSTEVCIIGIGGEEGSGKTTIAKAIYNQIHWTFKDKSFIENISQVSGIRGHLRLVEKLLLDVLKQKVEIPSIDVGRTIIREKLSGKRMLIVLDDVSNFILFDIWDFRKWSVEGTVIILTSTYIEPLRGGDSVFWVKRMNAEESLELLSWHAFREVKPKEEYKELATSVVRYCGGLPLALEVVGSTLFEKTKEEWNRLLIKYAIIDTHLDSEIIKVSIEGSLNEMEKDIFFDVCFFFVGKSRAYVTKILNECGVDADIAIRVLIQRNLIKINKNYKFGMHPLLQEIGIKIIRENSGKDLGKNRRLWFDKDTKYGTEALQWLPVKLLTAIESLQPTAISSDLLNKIRWISSHGLSSECLPNNIYEDDATAIDLKRSLLRFLWKTPQVLRSLKVLNLSHSKHLTTTPDFTGLPSLEHLIFKYCSRLRKLHQSIGSLNSLILLNLKDCTSLNNLPTEIYDLKSLRTFILSGCSKIDIMDKDIAKLESLITLIAENTAVKHVPFSIVSSKGIGYMSPRGFEGLSHNFFPSIIRSWMSSTTNPISYIHSFCMDMEDNTIDIAPLFSTLANIRNVLVACDTEFQLSKQVKNILVEYFANITESGISKQHLRCSLIGVGAYHQFFNVVSDNIYQVLASSESGDVCLPAVNDPYCLAHMGEGHSVSFVVPEDRDMKGMTLCVVYLSNPKIIEPEFTTVIIVNYTKCTFQIHHHGTVISFKDEDWHDLMSNLESGDNVEIFVNFGNGLVVKNTTVYLICAESKNMGKASEPKKHSLIRFVLRSIKVLNLSHSKYLTITPDFTGLPSLEYLILKYCSRLSKVHQSIGSLNSLILLNLKYCTSLNNLPTEIYDLKSLRTFILSGCSKIDIMDKDIAKLESLITLIAENTAVKLVPFSIVSSKSIGYISLRGFEGLSYNLFPSIIRSWMSPKMNPVSYIHSFCMDTEDSTIDIAPLLSTLANIRSVLVACDTDFQLSKQVKSILDEYFPSITESGISKQQFRCSLIGVGAYHQFFNAVSDNIYQVLANSESGEVCLPAVNDPNCLAHMGDGHSVSFIVPEDRDMKGMTLCIVYLSNPKIIEPEFTTVVVINYTKCTFQIHQHGTVISFKDEDWHDIMSNLECGDNVEIFVNFGNGLVVKNTTVYLICDYVDSLSDWSHSTGGCRGWFSVGGLLLSESGSTLSFIQIASRVTQRVVVEVGFPSKDFRSARGSGSFIRIASGVPQRVVVEVGFLFEDFRSTTRCAERLYHTSAQTTNSSTFISNPDESCRVRDVWSDRSLTLLFVVSIECFCIILASNDHPVDVSRGRRDICGTGS
ncbi:hypothetical protein V8G54_009857 [Vigna mungo]|uniref:TIR domain-containing protein n=1 Tax=Vigna mungo TaxID=3915 RepID=A0AAQ3NVB5_VIGMU